MKTKKAAKRRKLDNIALAFPVAAGKKDSRVFRIYCELKEPVEPLLLQNALESVRRHYPMFQSVLKRGNFWFYFEKKDIKPFIRKDWKKPCSPIYKKDQETLLYELSYSANRINFEVFHALTDGTGAIRFLSEIVSAYLDRKYSLQAPSPKPVSEAAQEEDSFSRNYSAKNWPKQIRKSGLAYQIKGKRLRQADMEITECTVSVRTLLEKARERGVSITVYMTAVLLRAIAGGMTEKQKKRPVVIMIPVNLRNYYRSQSMGNFFGWMEIEYCFRKDGSFEDVIAHVKQRFKEELDKDQVALRMNRLVNIEKNPVLRFIPLGLKNFLLKIGIWAGSRNVTAVLSNLSAVKMPEIYEPYIDRFGVITSTDKIQICACSYYDNFYFSITSKFADTGIQDRMLEFLRQEGIF